MWSVAAVFALPASMLVLLLVTAIHYGHVTDSLKVGMTIVEVLNKVKEPGLVHGILPPNDKIDHVALSGPYDGMYETLDLTQRKSLTPREAASLLAKHNFSLPGKEYVIAFTFSPFYGPHWSLPVKFDAENKVKAVLPVHSWD